MKIVNLKDYRQQKRIENQIRKLDELGEQQYQHMSSEEQKGYRNFMRLLKALDEKHKQGIFREDDLK